MGSSTTEQDSQSIANDVKVLREELRAQRDQVAVMEERLQHIGQHERRYSSTEQYQSATAYTEVTDGSDLNQDYMFLSVQNTIPQVRECCYADFKNRFDPDGKDGHYAVDVMVSGNLLYQEIRQEHSIREKLADLPLAPITKGSSSKPKSSGKTIKTAAAANSLILRAQTDSKWPRRIRIQSPVLLRALAKVNRETWSARARTYYRPFHSLIYFQAGMQALLKEMEERWKARSDKDAVPDQNGNSNSETYNISDAVLDSPGALECMREYVSYMEQRIMPDYRRFDDLDHGSEAKVRFSDLWHLFRTGELVCRRVTREARGQEEFRMAKRIWKTYFIDPMIERQIPLTADDKEAMDVEIDAGNTAFEIKCYYIDYNGWEFCVVKKKFRIEPYTGEISINSLPIYPLRFAERCQDKIEQSQRRGQDFLRCLKAKHCLYNGWTLTQSPDGDPVLDKNGSRVHQAEHVNSEVMIDFAETIQQCPQWKPSKASLRQKPVESLTKSELFRIRWQSGPDRAAILGETTELTPGKSGIPQKQRNEFLLNDPFLTRVRENSKHMRPTTEKDLTPECVLLLAKRVFAYIFQERKFAPLSVAKIRLSSKTGEALEMLKIPPSVKHAIQGSVQGHLMHKAIERRVDSAWTSLDLIEGKGTGLFILLHGVPGVGKTATAEAIAQANGKPLFKITVGDLGMTPDKLEISLREIFRLASIWDCILLLDEVDTFFSQRSQADTATNKNALVSVFLRVLDYYNGILFLTTNRAGVLDEAFKSRIHYKIYYPDLTDEQAFDIWKLNIDRVRKIEDQLAKVENREAMFINEDELLHLAKRLIRQGSGRKGIRWNGRQIRNAFQVARSLAYYEHGDREEKAARAASGAKAAREANPDTGAQAHEHEGSRSGVANPLVLAVQHFQTMAEITESFEKYRMTVHGGSTDADMALESEYRNDNYRDSVTDGYQLEYRDIHLRVPLASDPRMGRQEAHAAAGSRQPTPTSAYATQHQVYEHAVDDYPPGEHSISSSRYLPTAPGPRSRSGSNLSVGRTLTPIDTNIDAPQPGAAQYMRFPSSSPHFGAVHDDAMLPESHDATGHYQSRMTPRSGGGHFSSGFANPSHPGEPRLNISVTGPMTSGHPTLTHSHTFDTGAMSTRDPSPMRGESSGIYHHGRRAQDHDLHGYDGQHVSGPFSLATSHTAPSVLSAMGGQEFGGWPAASRAGQSQVPRNAESSGYQGTPRHASVHDAETDLSL